MITNVMSRNRIFTTMKTHTNNWKIERKDQKCYHDMIKYFLFLSQLFGLMPVSGILGSASSITFSLFSFRVGYLILIFFGMAFVFVFRSIDFISNGITFYRSSSPLFIFFSMITTLLTIKIAHGWPKLMENWAETENKLRFYSSNVNLRVRVYVVFVVFGLCGTIEHVLSVSSTFIVSQECYTPGDRFQAFFEVLFSQLFKRISYNELTALLVQFIELSNVFTWNFTDLLIILMSLGLTDLFTRISCRMEELQLQKTQENVWREIREDYNQVVNLCQHLNETISGLVLISFTNNLYFICVQLLRSIKAPKNAIEVIYFYFCLLFVLTRTLSLTLIASKINDGSRAPLKILFNVPWHSYCNEMNRFIQQINSDIVALTGLNLFRVRRGIILTVASTIVTYELVLVQFSQETEVLQSLSKNPQNTSCLLLGKI